ncbi:MAG TPA: NAD(P)H-dependent oxidoreductase, partial [Puia sp.]|nr:NAD(P)H-dependent oxidoreductase [Puia sp.]
MYCIISGTNRPHSNTLKVAGQYQSILKSMGIPASLVSLENLNVLERSERYVDLEEKVLIPSSKFIFISPEYNGSIPGVLKCMFDVSDVAVTWWNKKALLTGISTGRAGNLRGMDDLTGILHYLKVVVHPNKLPISVVASLLNADGEIADQITLAKINSQL